MHIEPGIVEAGKIGLSYATALGTLGLAAKLSFDHIKQSGLVSLLMKSVLSMLSVLVFFQVLPHHPVGVSEVHLIMGSTLFLMFGLAPAATGLALGLLAQGVFFAPFDLPQYGMNATTLIVPLVAMSLLAKNIIAPDTAYKDISYAQALKLSTTFQAGIVMWVAFWAFYGQGFAVENLVAVASFASAYMLVIIIEPLVDLGLLALVKNINVLKNSLFISRRVYFSAQ
ncbi:MAG: energy-coupling factor ABC transporter permease [gamma proteobacterium symbiont of Bathyaustriella thionipta]|nr:energy-coupling factor ABC transporter permease [gamma proteobacterium symbiont of Bathyaustriella thionipta]MCU7949647.1 energy-coupling factor ABC transporter permease [gamma proteobacterium symbiont of Bathyaustriella thionipta]MCU7954838.1 energy-coupling factor ABC transporter permease [gamma proteobacterium symbiont of Bathyaustriella thionipta]MCU7956226.1 energy-coupling factor ABC transporter permease [gamma proteobacterium symbiont of Bathyaustriella thionipta]MCU7966072.1 energy-c